MVSELNTRFHVEWMQLERMLVVKRYLAQYLKNKATIFQQYC